MAIFKYTQKEITPLTKSALEQEKIQETSDLQPLFRDHIELIDEKLLVITEKYRGFDKSRSEIDLLAVDQDANLVVIELKGAKNNAKDMELQGLRYGALIADMPLSTMWKVYSKFKDLTEEEAKAELLIFFSDTEEYKRLEDVPFGRKVKIILVSPYILPEVATTAMWLNSLNEEVLEVTCLELSTYKLGDEVFLDLRQVIPPMGIEDYLVKTRLKQSEFRQASKAQITLFIDDEPYDLGVANLGLGLIKKLIERDLLTEDLFAKLKPYKGCGFEYFKTLEEMSENEVKRNRYSHSHNRGITDNWFEFSGQRYYVARNWNRQNCDALVEFVNNLIEDYEIRAKIIE